MTAIHSQALVPLTPVRGKICGMGIEVPCDLLLDWQTKPSATASAVPQWTILRAPADFPDGDYTVIANDGLTFPAKRIDGSWMHRDIEESNASDQPWAGQIADHIAQRDRRYAIALMFFAAVLTYVLPTVIELVAAHDPGFGIGVIVFGDLTGCACLAALLGMPMFGVVLYVLLALSEAALYFTGVLSATTMAWFADMLPTLVVAGRIARMHTLSLRTSER